jgi:hypothetical protein
MCVPIAYIVQPPFKSNIDFVLLRLSVRNVQEPESLVGFPWPRNVANEDFGFSNGRKKLTSGFRLWISGLSMM